MDCLQQRKRQCKQPLNSLASFCHDTVAIRTMLVDAHLAGIYKHCGPTRKPRHAVVDETIEVASGIVLARRRIDTRAT